MVDNNPPTVNALKANREVLDCLTVCEVQRHDARQYLKQLAQGGRNFDLVFLDPPFEAPELASSVLSLLLAHDLVRHQIFLEMRSKPNSDLNLDSMLENHLVSYPWQTLKTTRTGESQAVLLQRLS